MSAANCSARELLAAGKRIDLVAVGPRAIIYEETYRRIAKTL